MINFSIACGKCGSNDIEIKSSRVPYSIDFQIHYHVSSYTETTYFCRKCGNMESDKHDN